MNALTIYTKFQSLPPSLQQEAADFIDFLMTKPEAKKERPVPQFGSAKGKIHMADDFDAPLDEFKDYM